MSIYIQAIFDITNREATITLLPYMLYACTKSLYSKTISRKNKSNNKENLLEEALSIYIDTSQFKKKLGNKYIVHVNNMIDTFFNHFCSYRKMDYFNAEYNDYKAYGMNYVVLAKDHPNYLHDGLISMHSERVSNYSLKSQLNFYGWNVKEEDQERIFLPYNSYFSEFAAFYNRRNHHLLPVSEKKITKGFAI